MTTTLLTANHKAASFPNADLTDALRKWWEKEIDAVESDPSAPPAGALADALPAVDSLTVVGVLIQIENLPDFELPDSVVKRGGYHTLTEMTDHLLDESCPLLVFAAPAGATLASSPGCHPGERTED